VFDLAVEGGAPGGDAGVGYPDGGRGNGTDASAPSGCGCRAPAGNIPGAVAIALGVAAVCLPRRRRRLRA
jgi:hypothetical protein